MGELPNYSYSIPVTVKISWTTKNPGKKFYGCAYYEHNNGRGGCGYFKWHETSGCERCDKLVRHTRRLTKKVKDLETDVEKRKLKECRMNLMLFMTIVAVIYQWLWKSNLDEIDMPNAGNDLNLVRESGIPESRTILGPLQRRFKAIRQHILVHVPIPSSSNYVLPRKIFGGFRQV